MTKKVNWFLILLLLVNFLVIIFTIQNPKDQIGSIFYLAIEVIFVLPLLLGLASRIWRKTFSLYPTYLLAIAHLLALIPWLIFIFLTFGMALLIQGYSYKDAWIAHPWPVTIITIQDVLWTFIAPSVFASSLEIYSSRPLRYVFTPLKYLSWSRKVAVMLLLAFYIPFVLFYYLELLGDFGFVPFIGPPS